MAEQVRQVALDADPVSLGAIVAITQAVDACNGGIIRIDDPAIASNFTA